MPAIVKMASESHEIILADKAQINVESDDAEAYSVVTASPDFLDQIKKCANGHIHPVHLNNITGDKPVDGLCSTVVIFRQGINVVDITSIKNKLNSKGFDVLTCNDDLEAQQDNPNLQAYLDAVKVSLWAKEQPVEKVKAAPKKLFELEQASVKGYLSSKPPEPKFLIKNLIRLGITGFLEGAGGTSKSIAFMQLQVCLAAGRKWMGKFEIASEGIGSSVVIYGEETSEELQYRLYYICDHMNLTLAEKEKVYKRVFMFSAVDEEYTPVLSKNGNNEAAPTDFVEKLIATVEFLTDLVFVGIDPLAKYFGGGMMDNKDAYRYAGELKKICKAKGCTVLTLNHVNKSGMKEGGNLEAAGYGSVAFRDSSRIMLNMTKMTDKQANAYDDIEEGTQELYVKLTLTKGNYTAPQTEAWWFKRLDYGILEWADLNEIEKHEKSDNTWMFVLSYISKGYANGQKYNITQLREAAKNETLTGESGKKIPMTQIRIWIDYLLNDGIIKEEVTKNPVNNNKVTVYVPANVVVFSKEDQALAEAL